MENSNCFCGKVCDFWIETLVLLKRYVFYAILLW